MVSMLRLLLSFLITVFAGQSWGLAGISQNGNYQYDVNRIALNKKNYDYDTTSKFGCRGIGQSATSREEKVIEGGVLAFVNGFFVTKSAERAFPRGSVGAAKAWSTKSRLKDAGLPVSGKIRFVPPRGYHPSQPLTRGPNKGFIDRFGN